MHNRAAPSDPPLFSGDISFQLLDSAPDSMVIIDHRGRIVYVNSQTEQIFGFLRAELLEQPVELLIPRRFRAGHIHHRDQYFIDPNTRPMGAGLELYGLRKDGTEFPVEISLSPLRTKDGSLTMSAIRDITEQRRLQEQLWRKNEELEEQYRRVQDANRLKSEFLANMSHELRTPLNGIIGFAQLMHDEKVGPISADHKEYLGDILTSSGHLLQLINDVLDLAKVESGKMEFRPEAIEMAQVVGEVRDILRVMSAGKAIDVEVWIDPDVGVVQADSARLKQILYNYLSNAIKFTPNDGHVTVRVEPAGPKAYRIEVRDTGIGIAAEDMHRLFVEFQQLDASTAKRYQGTGLGLALTKRIAEAQGGVVGADSTLGGGSTFYAILPYEPPGLEPGVA